MLNLLAFAPCEKALVADDHTSTLITILEVMSLSISTEQLATTPTGLFVPFRWHVFTLWHRTSPDDSGDYVQCVRLIFPNGEVGLNIEMPFSIHDGDRNFRGIARLDGFPVSSPGECRLTLALRRAGEESWREVADYPLMVKLLAAPSASERAEPQE